MPDTEAELAADALWQAGAAAIEERPGLLIAATAAGGDPAELAAAVGGRWPAEVVPVDLDAALDAWREHARPVMVADRLVVRPPWVDPPGRPCDRAGLWLPANHNPAQLRAQRPSSGDRPGGAASSGAASGGAESGGRPMPEARAPERLTSDHIGARASARREPAGPGPVPDGTRGPVDVAIDPGRAFGSGAHPSTRLALAALVDLVRGGERVLDVGCGSGVLAIAALLLGAAAAAGVDIDPAAADATRVNAERNGVGDRLTVAADLAVALVGSSGEAGAAGGHGPRPAPAPMPPSAVHVPPSPHPAPMSPFPAPAGVTAAYDIVVANLLLPDLLAVAPAMVQAAGRRGSIVVSGVLTEQRDAALAPFAAAGCERETVHEDEGWLALTLRPG